MISDAQLGYWTGLAIANADEMQQWVEGDEFEAPAQSPRGRRRIVKRYAQLESVCFFSQRSRRLAAIA